jgi:hypothetical protein
LVGAAAVVAPFAAARILGKVVDVLRPTDTVLAHTEGELSLGIRATDAELALGRTDGLAGDIGLAARAEVTGARVDNAASSAMRARIMANIAESRAAGRPAGSTSSAPPPVSPARKPVPPSRTRRKRSRPGVLPGSMPSCLMLKGSRLGRSRGVCGSTEERTSTSRSAKSSETDSARTLTTARTLDPTSRSAGSSRSNSRLPGHWADTSNAIRSSASTTSPPTGGSP